MSDAKDKTTIDKWQRKLATMEQESDKAVKNMKKAIAMSMKDRQTHENIAREMLDAKRGNKAPVFREGFGDDGEVYTGIGDDRPWERD